MTGPPFRARLSPGACRYRAEQGRVPGPHRSDEGAFVGSGAATAPMRTGVQWPELLEVLEPFVHFSSVTGLPMDADHRTELAAGGAWAEVGLGAVAVGDASHLF